MARKLILAAAVLAVAMALMVAGAGTLAYTNTEEFCISCHEMRDNVYAEYKDTIHDKNRAGVRAVCSDCHVPRAPLPMLLRKAGTYPEIWGKITGVIDTKEKFEKHRADMAQREWRRLKANDSLECRNCHKLDSMDPEKTSDKAKSRHAKGKAENKTCIDCHFGIAHKEPDGPGPQEMKF